MSKQVEDIPAWHRVLEPRQRKEGTQVGEITCNRELNTLKRTGVRFLTVVINIEKDKIK